MTFSEFNIRYFSYIRQQKERQFLFREVAYASMIGGKYDDRKLKKDKYWPIYFEEEKRDFTEQINALRKAQEIYNNERNRS